jgi:hypothetical protein
MIRRETTAKEGGKKIPRIIIIWLCVCVSAIENRERRVTVTVGCYSLIWYQQANNEIKIK